ncbi:hypothetical protein MLD38_010609 [Melastoma candidum]|uniref:Uncharacterized protein n=1 Tax=Melastoma candidum TaxID=119954 RepID=A0ACB9R1H0_9MYRT|nr:hypothetical protein MLD38_010609 [Melastoma candidum]
MGANLSALGSEVDGGISPSRPRFDDIPESCVASVLIHLDPPEICSLARLNRAFRGASSADFIWEGKLPTNYRAIVDKVLDEPKMGNLRKKEIYAKLCAHIPFDSGTKEIWLDKGTGGVCLSISSKALTITGINDRRYWNHISTEQSRFNTVAYLKQIWWLEVDGELEFPFPAGTYSIFFRLMLGKPGKRIGRCVCNPDQIHGWNIKPVKFELTASDGQRSSSQCYLDNLGSWVCYHAGDFVVKDPEKWTRISFSMAQIDCTHTKGGLSLDSVVVCPSSLGKFN